MIVFMFLLQTWDKAMNYSDQRVGDAKSNEKYFKNFFGAAKTVLRIQKSSKAGEDDVSYKVGHLARSYATSSTKNTASLLDEFKTFQVIQWLVELYKNTTSKNVCVGAKGIPKSFLIQKVAVYVAQILPVFGAVFGAVQVKALVLETVATNWLPSRECRRLWKKIYHYPIPECFLSEFHESIRTTARSNKTATAANLVRLCDAVHDSSSTLAWLRCSGGKTNASVWKLDDPVRSVGENKLKAAQAEAKKLETK